MEVRHHDVRRGRRALRAVAGAMAAGHDSARAVPADGCPAPGDGPAGAMVADRAVLGAVVDVERLPVVDGATVAAAAGSRIRSAARAHGCGAPARRSGRDNPGAGAAGED